MAVAYVGKAGEPSMLMPCSRRGIRCHSPVSSTELHLPGTRSRLWYLCAVAARPPAARVAMAFLNWSSAVSRVARSTDGCGNAMLFVIPATTASAIADLCISRISETESYPRFSHSVDLLLL